MFDYSNMLKRAIEYFPMWSDIRKRTSKSVGGQLIDSTLKETLELESAINQYKDYYFLNKYDNKEDEVIAFVYSCNIGLIEHIENLEVYYNTKQYHLTLDITEFYDKQTKNVYYENGMLYIKELVNDISTIEVNMDEYKYTYTLKKTHV